MKSTAFLLCIIFVRTSKACLEVTTESWKFDEERDLLFQDSSYDKCYNELFEHQGFMGFSFQEDSSECRVYRALFPSSDPPCKDCTTTTTSMKFTNVPLYCVEPDRYVDDFAFCVLLTNMCKNIKENEKMIANLKTEKKMLKQNLESLVGTLDTRLELMDLKLTQALEIENTREAKRLAEIGQQQKLEREKEERARKEREEQQKLEREREERARKEREEEGFQCLQREEEERLQEVARLQEETRIREEARLQEEARLKDIERKVLNKDECGSYNNLTHHRNTNHRSKDKSGKRYCDKLSRSYVSPDWKGTGWYRFTGPSGTRMPTKAPGKFHCGTYATGWLKGNHPSTPGKTLDATVCFDYDGNECWQSIDVKVTNCNSYFVYYLPDTPNCWYRYCATNDRI